MLPVPAVGYPSLLERRLFLVAENAGSCPCHHGWASRCQQTQGVCSELRSAPRHQPRRPKPSERHSSNRVGCSCRSGDRARSFPRVPQLAQLSRRARVRSILTGKSALNHVASRQRCGAGHTRAKRLATSSRGAGGRRAWRLPQRGRRSDPFDLPMRDAPARGRQPEEARAGCDDRLSFLTW
jgi:hypothetical protein